MSVKKNRVAIVGGVRTPFVKAGTHYAGKSMCDLGVAVVRGLVDKYKLDSESVDELVMSTVLLDPRAPNWAREILFQTQLSPDVYAHSVTNNCISGLVAINSLADRIALGRVRSGIAGGTESMSNPSLVFSKEASDIFLALFRARSLGDKLGIIARFRPKHFFPTPPSVTEPSTGLTMGQHMEITAKEMMIARSEQDEIAFQSHNRAHTAAEEGIFNDSLIEVAGVSKDTIVRKDTSVEKLAKLRTVFDRSDKGTLTAGNSSPLTDGASAVLLMSEEEASRQGREVYAYIADYEYAAIDPNKGLLMAPALAVPRMLRRNGMMLEDFDLIEIHEAFAAQVLANIKAWEQGLYDEPVGVLDREKLNVCGGSIAIGHPFAATGGRIVDTLARELARRNLNKGLVSICAAGGMAGAMILER